MKDKITLIVKDAYVKREMLDRGLFDIPALKSFLKKVEGLLDSPPPKEMQVRDWMVWHLEKMKRKEMKQKSK